MLQPLILCRPVFSDPTLARSFVWLTSCFCWSGVQNPPLPFLCSPVSKGVFKISVSTLAKSFQGFGYWQGPLDNSDLSIFVSSLVTSLALILLFCKIRGACPSLMKPKAEISQANSTFSSKTGVVLLQEGNMFFSFQRQDYSFFVRRGFFVCSEVRAVISLYIVYNSGIKPSLAQHGNHIIQGFCSLQLMLSCCPS